MMNDPYIPHVCALRVTWQLDTHTKRIHACVCTHACMYADLVQTRDVHKITSRQCVCVCVFVCTLKHTHIKACVCVYIYIYI